MADGDIFSSLHSTGENGSLTVGDAHQKIVATPSNSLSTDNGMFSTIINDNHVTSGDFSRSVIDSNLNSDHTYNLESLVYQNNEISTQTNTSSALTALLGTTGVKPMGDINAPNPNTLLPFINKTDTSVSCIGSDYVPNTDYQLTDYTLFQSVIQNTIFEGFGAYSTTQGFQQNLVNLLLTDDSQLYGGYNFGTSSRLPLIMFDVTRQFLNTKLGFRWKSNIHSNTSTGFKAAGNGNSNAHVKADGVAYTNGTASHERIQLGLDNTALLKNYKSAVWTEYIHSYTFMHTPQNLTAKYLKGKDSEKARGDSNCLEYINQITEENSQNATHGENDYIEITMEEVRRELFKTLACPELFGQIFYDQRGVDWVDGPSGALHHETEFEYDQNDVNTWKGGQIRISNINEARLWLLQYRNWLIHKLKQNRVYNRVQKNNHPLLREVDNVEHFFYNLDSFTIALITGGASLPDLYANVLDVHQKVQFKTDDNDTIGNPLRRCGLLSNNDFLRWAHIGSAATIAAANNTDHAAVVNTGNMVGDGNISGIYYEQQTLGYGQQIGGDTLFGMKVTNNNEALSDLPGFGSVPSDAQKRYQYRNSDASLLDISGVNFNPLISEFDSGSTITSFTYEPNLQNNWWEDSICAGIKRDWVLPINARLDTTSKYGVVANNKYYTSGNGSVETEIYISTSVSSVINGVEWNARGRGNPGFLTNDVFNVSNWAWSKYVTGQTGQHAHESTNSGNGNGAGIHNIDDFIVDLTITNRNTTLQNVTTQANTQTESDTVHPKMQDPRQVTRTLCHNAFGASIKILDPIRQLHDACGSGHTWLATENGSLITHDSNTPKIVDRQLGFGFCLGDLISVGQSHHFNIGSRISTHSKRRASIRKGNKGVQIPVEFNAVVNCEFALMLNVVDRCTDTVRTVYRDSNGTGYDQKLLDGLLEVTTPSTKQNAILSKAGQADGFVLASMDVANWCDLRGDLFNDVYNLSLLYLARNNKPALNYFKIQDVQDIEQFNESEHIFYSAEDPTHNGAATVGGGAIPLIKYNDTQVRPWERNIFEAGGNASPQGNTYSPGHDKVRGTNLIFRDQVNNTYHYPHQEDNNVITTFYDPGANGTADIEVSPTKDILNLWWDYIPADRPTLLVNNGEDLYGDIYKQTGTNLLSTLPPDADNLTICTMYVPIWNTAALRRASVIDDDVLRGNTLLPIDPDLQSGAMIGVEQVVTTESDVTTNILFRSQPNPLLFTNEGAGSNNITERILPHATLNQGSIANGPQNAMANTEAPETGNLVPNEAGAISANVQVLP